MSTRGSLTLPEPNDWHLPRRPSTTPIVHRRVGSVVFFEGVEQAIIVTADGWIPAKATGLDLANHILAAGVIGRGQGGTVIARRERVDAFLAHEVQPGISLSHVIRALDGSASGGVAAAVGAHLARAWAGLGLGARAVAIPSGGVLHPSPDEVVTRKDRVLLQRTESLRAHAVAPRPRLGSHRADVDPHLVAIVDASLDVDPRARPASLLELERELTALADPPFASALLGNAATNFDPTARARELAGWNLAAERAAGSAPGPYPTSEWPLPPDPITALEAALPSLVDYY